MQHTKKAVWKSAFLNFIIIADLELLQYSFCNSSGLCKIARKTFMDSWKR